MTSAQERLAALKDKLAQARNENLKAVKDEGNGLSHVNSGNDGNDAEQSSDEEERSTRKYSGRKRRVSKRERSNSSEIGSADEADGEDEDDGLRSMKRRAKNLAKIIPASRSGEKRVEVETISYGVTGHDAKVENIDRMVNELKEVDKRRKKLHRRRTFDENRTDITFINEGNRLFNRTLDKHFDKFESVQKIKDSLERGTA